MMKFTSSGKITPTGASADSTSLVGVAMKASPATDLTATKIKVALIGQGTVFEFTVDTGLHTYGTCFVINNTDQELTSKTVVNLGNTATNVVAICAQDMGSTGTNCLVEFLPGRFQATIDSK
jgi:hypothetical protein